MYISGKYQDAIFVRAHPLESQPMRLGLQQRPRQLKGGQSAERIEAIWAEKVKLSLLTSGKTYPITSQVSII